MAHNSLVEPIVELTDSDNEPLEQAYSMVMIKLKSTKTCSPRSMIVMLHGYTRHDAACNSERAAAEERVSSSDEVEARMSVDWSLQEDLFGDNHTQDLPQVINAMNAQEEVSEPNMDDSNTCEQGQVEDNDTWVDESVENQAIDQEDSIIDETLNLSAVKDSARGKSKKYNIPSDLVPSDSEDKLPRPIRRKRSKRGASISHCRAPQGSTRAPTSCNSTRRQHVCQTSRPDCQLTDPKGMCVDVRSRSR